jgi:hypothetical protein
MSASWKQYGGAKSLETNRKITTNTVVTDEIVLKNSFIGSFNITGVLDVSGKAYLQGGLDVSGSISSSEIYTNSISVYNNSLLYGSVFADGDISANKNIIVGNSVSVGNNLTVTNNAYISKNLFLNKDSGGNFDQFIFGDVSGIGINTVEPIYALDINTNNINSLRVNSNNITNQNIIASNIDNTGITVTSAKYDDNNGGSNSSINFWVNNPLFSNPEGDAYIKAKNSGLLEINSATDTVILSTLCVSHRPDEVHNHVFNETVIIYDMSSGSYKTEIYDNEDAHTGNALTLVSDDSTSTTFLNILTPSGEGIGIAGGSYPTDTSRSVGIVGIYETSNNYLQNQIIVSGTDPVKYKTTLGINTYIPKTENYTVDINGPVHINNGDITIVKNTDFQIIQMVSSPTKDLVMAVGTPTNILDPSYGYSRILISNNYGSTWRESMFMNSSATHFTPFVNITNKYIINDIAIYDNSYAIIVYSDSTYRPNILYSYDGGIYWNTVTVDPNTFSNAINYNFRHIVIKDAPRYDNSGNTYFTLFISTNSNSSYIGVYTINLVFNINGGKITNNNNYIFNSGNIQGFKYYYQTNTFYFATTSGIYLLNNINNYVLKSNSSSYIYNAIHCNNNNIIAVGNNIISTSIDGNSFIDISFNNISFTSIYIFNNFAYTIGNNNTIWLSKDYGFTWNTLWNSMDNISQSGKQWLLMNPSNIFSNIIMTDLNTILLSNTISPNSAIQSDISHSTIINCFFPNLYNRENNNVLDISGNMRIYGDICVDDNGKIISNNSVFSLINENVKTVNFAGNASQIIIGNTTNGNTVIRNNLKVNLNGNILGNLSLYGQETIYNTTDSSILNTGALIVNGGTSISKTTNLGGNLYVGQNSLLTGTLGVLSDTSLNGNLIINSGSSSSGYNSGSLIVNGGIGISGNINIKKTANIIGALNVNLDTTLNGNLIINSNISSLGYTSGSLIVNGGTGIYGNLNIGNNISINGNINMINTSSLAQLNKVIITGNINSTNISSGSLIINGGIGISQDTFIGGNININGAALINGNVVNNQNIFIKGNLSVVNGIYSNSSILTNGNIIVFNNTPSTNINSGAVIISGGIGIGGNLYVGNSINGYLINTNYIRSTGNLNIGYTDDINTQFINIGSTNNININQISNTISIGKTPPNLLNYNIQNNIRIGNPDTSVLVSVSNPKGGLNSYGSNTYYSYISIGGPNDIVSIQGATISIGGIQQFSSSNTNTTTFSTIVQYSKYAILDFSNNYGNVALLGGNDIAYGAGLWIQNLGIPNMGQFVVSTDLNAYIFKAPTYNTINAYTSDLSNSLQNQNIVRLDINKLVTTTTNGLVVLSPLINDKDSARYTVTATNIDISNIFIKSADISFNIQTVATNVIMGNTLTVTGNFISNKYSINNNILINTVNPISNASLTISGNAIISKLGIGTTSVNSNANSLEVKGNIYQTQGGYIYQF